MQTEKNTQPVNEKIRVKNPVKWEIDEKRRKASKKSRETLWGKGVDGSEDPLIYNFLESLILAQDERWRRA